MDKLMDTTWRIIRISKWLVTPIYKPFRPFGMGITLLRGRQLTMVINHLLTGMILQAQNVDPGTCISGFTLRRHFGCLLGQIIATSHDLTSKGS